MKPPVFILCLFDTGYYVARLLKKTGIIIYGFDLDHNNHGFYSKYIKSFLVPHPQKNSDKLFEFLLNKCREFDQKPILIPCSEDYLAFLNSYRDELQNYFLFILPESNILKKILDKSSQFEMAKRVSLDVPLYINISVQSDLEQIPDHFKYPLIIKGLDQVIWKNKVNEKAFLAQAKTDLFEIGNDLIKKNVPFIVQEQIRGEINENFEYNALMIDGKIIEQQVIQKIQQYPLDFGTACCIKTVDNKDVETMGAKFVTENGLTGFSNTEFKFDKTTNKYYFIETNARVWQQIELTKIFNAIIDKSK